MDAMPLKRLKEGFNISLRNIDNIMIMNPSLSLPVQAISIDYDSLTARPASLSPFQFYKENNKQEIIIITISDSCTG